MLLTHAFSIVLALAGFQDQGPLIWTGRLKAGSDKDESKSTVELRAQVAELRTRTELARDFAAQLASLDRLRARQSRPGEVPGKPELAADIAMLRADWLEKLGRHDEAVFAAWHPFVMPQEKDKAPYDEFVWGESNGALAELLRKVDQLQATVDLRKRFHVGADSKKDEDPIDVVVRSAIVNGDPRSLRDFGPRCVPALQKALLEGPEELSNRLPEAADPLAILLALDRVAGEKLILSSLGGRGPVWTLRAMSALNYSGVTRSSWVQPGDPYAPPRFDDALTLQVLDAFAGQPLAAQAYFELLKPIVGAGVVTPAIRSFLLGQVQTTDPIILTQLREMLDQLRTSPEKLPLHAAFIDSPDPQLRFNCATALLRYPAGPELLRAAAHSDPQVRATAVRGLVRHRMTAWNFAENTARDPVDARWYEVQRTPAIEAALLKAAHDAEQSVRLALARALIGAQESPPSAVLDTLLGDPDAAVRAAVVWGWGSDLALQARVLERCAGDADPGVIVGVINALYALAPGTKPGNAAGFDAYLPALTKLLENPHLVVKDNRPVTNLLQVALWSPGGARAVFDICMHGPRSAEFGPPLLDSVRWTTNNAGEVPIDTVLEAPALAEIFALACTRLDANRIDWTVRAVQSLIENGSLDAAPILALARTAEQTRELRLRALQAATSKAGPADAQAYLEILRTIKAEEVDPENRQTHPLFLLVLGGFRTNGWPAAALAGFGKQVLADTGVADMLASRVAANALDATREKLDAASTAIAVERWMRLKQGEIWEAGPLLKLLDPGLDARVLALWRAMAKGSLAQLDPLLNAIDAHPVDESVDPLVEVITRTDASIPGESRNRAIALLARRLDDRGADALLRAVAAAPYDTTRQKCLEGLDQIRKYQDEKQSWQRRKGGEAAREQAIADLLPMLGDKDASTRAAAARSLGTLQAVEHLPKLVALLKDKDASVREAAQKALDAINAASAKKP